jgi:hypothetical protein
MGQHTEPLGVLSISSITYKKAQDICDSEWGSIVWENGKAYPASIIECVWKSTQYADVSQVNINSLQAEITTLRARVKELEASKGEPVAYMDNVGVGTISVRMINELTSRGNGEFPYHLWQTPLYTSPPIDNKDAERYRWLRKATIITEGIYVRMVLKDDEANACGYDYISHEDLDSYIDKAMDSK